MALLCGRHGGGLLLHFILFVCSFRLLSLVHCLFIAYQQCTRCAKHLLIVRRAWECMRYAWGMNWRKTTLLALAWLILSIQVVQCSAGALAMASQLVYSQTEEVRKTRKPGRRGGIRQLVRRATKLPLPPVVLCNTRSLRHKMDDLRSQVGASYEYRESGLMVFTETWLNDDIPDSSMQVDGFTLIRSDRNSLVPQLCCQR